ncbi:MAG TPA: cellulose synthase family protein [Flavisolibacter sp.]|nr:cellulose synthase family protein [Flavisolibacter sp.]
MIDFIVALLVVLYGLALFFMVFHSLSDAHLIYHYLTSGHKNKKTSFSEIAQPSVTIQLPIYNEVYVVERLLEAVAAIDYPKDKTEIQVLDDSTDETSDVIKEKVVCLRQKNIDVQHIKRANREGFKAGALKHGLSLANGELIAVFDADFLPPKDFLHKTLPYFTDEHIGMVQTKWGHINKEASLLTNLQAIALDGHFSIEQTGRNAAGYFINFNGTGGVWRKQCILDAGNWEADTLTEDLDLSYRAQLKDWKFIYLEDVTTPAELPPVMSAFKSQQFRWAKGGAETARKNMRKLLLSNQSFSVKWHGLFHLVYSLGFVSIITSLVLSLPLILVRDHYPEYDNFFTVNMIVAYSFLIYILHYFISYQKNNTGSFSKKLAGFIVRFPLFVSLFIGVSLNNAIGIIQGYLGIKSGFVRTPKFNTNTVKFWPQNKYTESRIKLTTVLEGLLALYFIAGILLAIQSKHYVHTFIFLMAAAGFSFVCIATFRENQLMGKKA